MSMLYIVGLQVYTYVCARDPQWAHPLRDHIPSQSRSFPISNRLPSRQTKRPVHDRDVTTRQRVVLCFVVFFRAGDSMTETSTGIPNKLSPLDEDS